MPLASATSTNFPVEYRVRSFMQANCAQCHIPANPIIARWDARFETALPEKGLEAAIVAGNPRGVHRLHQAGYSRLAAHAADLDLGS